MPHSAPVSDTGSAEYSDTTPTASDPGPIYGERFSRQAKALGIEEAVIAPRSPWQNAYAERVIGSIRRECLASSNRPTRSSRYFCLLATGTIAQSQEDLKNINMLLECLTALVCTFHGSSRHAATRFRRWYS